MTDNHKALVSALNTVLPTHYEMVLHSGLATPCISYMETNNYMQETGDTLGYSVITYQVKVWATKVEEIQQYTLEVDRVLRQLGYRRIASGELYDNQSTMIQKILTYEARALENY